jgi:hypothetical protein
MRSERLKREGKPPSSECGFILEENGRVDMERAIEGWKHR